MFKAGKYRKFPGMQYPDRRWPSAEITKAPIWCSVDLRDGNQALVEPMNVGEKLRLFRLLCDLGIREIEVGFPAASNTEKEFVRTLVKTGAVPDDVYIQVLAQCREEQIRETFETIAGLKKVIFHIYNPTSVLQREVVFGKTKEEVTEIAVRAAELVKKLGIDVYWLTQDGAYKSVPKWAGLKFRPGKVLVHGGKLFDKDQIKDLSIEEIKAGLDKAIYHDEDKIFTDVSYKSKEPARGLDGILYKCPVCNEEFMMKSEGDRLWCDKCGAEWTLDTRYVLHGPVFDRINTWYEWQGETIDLDETIDSQVTVSTPGEDGLLVKDAGEGRLTVDRDAITFSGTVLGKPLEFSEKTTITSAFPASVADHVSMYSKRVLYYFHPVPDKRACVKWVQYLDKVTKERKNN